MLELLVFSSLNGIVYGLLLFLLASGLTLVFSLMGVLNFAHAAFYMLGAYLGWQISRWVGWWPALLLSPLAVGLLGGLVQRYGLRRVHAHGHVAELLFTFGLAFLVEEGVQMVWGRLPLDYRVPAALDFPAFTLWQTRFPAFRLFMLVASLVVFAALGLALVRTRIGLVIRASLAHPSMVAMLGHDVPRVFMGVFGIGCALAALAGTIAGPVLVTQPSMAASIGPILFVVVVVGGLGSLAGAFIGSILIGLVQTFAVAVDVSLLDLFGAGASPWLGDLAGVTVAQLAPVVPYLLLVAVLLFRPRGLMGERET